MAFSQKKAVRGFREQISSYKRTAVIAGVEKTIDIVIHHIDERDEDGRRFCIVCKKHLLMNKGYIHYEVIDSATMLMMYVHKRCHVDRRQFDDWNFY